MAARSPIDQAEHDAAPTSTPKSQQGPSQQRLSWARSLTIAALIFDVLPVAVLLTLPIVTGLGYPLGLYPWLGLTWTGIGGACPLLAIAVGAVALIGYLRARENGGWRVWAIVGLIVGLLEAVPVGAAAIYLISIGGWNFLI